MKVGDFNIGDLIKVTEVKEIHSDKRRSKNTWIYWFRYRQLLDYPDKYESAFIRVVKENS